MYMFYFASYTTGSVVKASVAFVLEVFLISIQRAASI